jgi:hypothetical protein
MEATLVERIVGDRKAQLEAACRMNTHDLNGKYFLTTTSALVRPCADGTRLLQYGSRRVRVLDAETLETLHCFEAEACRAWRRFVSRDGKLFVAESHGREKLIVYDLVEGVLRNEVPLRDSSPTKQISASGNASRAAVAYIHNLVRVVCLQTGETLATIEEPALYVQLSEDGLTLFTAGTCAVRWDATSGKLISRTEPFCSYAKSLALSPCATLGAVFFTELDAVCVYDMRFPIATKLWRFAFTFTMTTCIPLLSFAGKMGEELIICESDAVTVFRLNRKAYDELFAFAGDPVKQLRDGDGDRAVMRRIMEFLL